MGSSVAWKTQCCKTLIIWVNYLFKFTQAKKHSVKCILIKDQSEGGKCKTGNIKLNFCFCCKKLLLTIVSRPE